MPVRLACLGLAIVAIGLAVTAVHAQGDAAPVTYPEAARRTLQQRPQLRALALQIAAADARREQAKLKPPLELVATAEGFGGTGVYRTLDGVEATISLAAVFERGGKRDARIVVADRDRVLLDVERRIEALDVLAETGRRFVAVAAAQDRVRLATLSVSQAERTVELVTPRVAAARSPRTELLNAELQLNEERLRRDAAIRELESAQSELAAQWNEPDARPSVALQLLSVPATQPFSDLLSQLRSLPDLSRYAAAAALRDAQVRLVRAQASADVRWSLGARRIQESGDQALVAGISIPLNAARRNKPFEREAQLRRDAVDAEEAVTRLTLEPLLFRQLSLLATARERIQSVSDFALPRAEEALALTERGYRIGRFPYRELAVAQAQVIDLQAERLDAARQYHLTRIEIERLTGAQLPLLSE
jgi:cobalt-zinc-cadmium efflux system outer membrane protein